MSTLPFKDIRILAQHQIRLVNLDAEIASLREMMDQLVYDTCTVRVILSISNHSIQELQQQQHYVQEVLNGGPVNNFTGQPLKKAQYEPAKSHTLFSESAAIRVLQAILEEKITERNSLLEDMGKLMDVTGAPTQDRYQPTVAITSHYTSVCHERV